MIELVILDMYGTIVGMGDNATPRNGFAEFMDRCQDKKVVLATDEQSRDHTDSNLTKLGIIERLDGVYTYQNMVDPPGSRGKVKDLGQICADYGVDPANAVFIGDGNSDLRCAEIYGVKFIHVPRYKKEDEPFSFDIIDLSKSLPQYINLRDVNTDQDYDAKPRFLVTLGIIDTDHSINSRDSELTREFDTPAQVRAYIALRREHYAGIGVKLHESIIKERVDGSLVFCADQFLPNRS